MQAAVLQANARETAPRSRAAARASSRGWPDSGPPRYGSVKPQQPRAASTAMTIAPSRRATRRTTRAQRGLGQSPAEAVSGEAAHDPHGGDDEQHAPVERERLSLPARRGTCAKPVKELSVMIARLVPTALRHRHAGDQHQRGHDQESATDAHEPAQQRRLRSRLRRPRPGDAARAEVAGHGAAREHPPGREPASPRRTAASWTGPGTQCASVAPSQAPAMPGRPNHATLRQSTCRLARTARQRRLRSGPTTSSEPPIASLSGWPSR